jgi:transposase
MDSVKYIGMDVHKEAISLAVLNSSGKLVMEYIIETKASSILQFFEGLRRSLQGIKPEMARLTLARKIAAITLTVWKKGVRFDAQYLKPQTA